MIIRLGMKKKNNIIVEIKGPLFWIKEMDFLLSYYKVVI